MKGAEGRGSDKIHDDGFHWVVARFVNSLTKSLECRARGITYYMSVLKRSCGAAIAMKPPIVVEVRKAHIVPTIVRTLRD